MALLLAAFLLAAPMTALAKKGEKNYKRGLQYEQAQQWEKAAQEFALAVAANPSDTEYQLHYRRAIFNASQVFMQKGRVLSEQGDYIGAYNAFRQAYGYDPVNDLAVQEMERMLRLQREKEGADGPANGAKVSPTAYRGSPNGVAASTANGTSASTADDLPMRAEQLQTIQYSGELEPFIRKLADELNLNVVFDQNFSQVRRNINVKWKDITPARALDYIFQSQGLFFQKLDRRTILVADQSKRPMYQQLVVRTFYLYNTKPEDARTLIQQTLPANAGRQPSFAVNTNTNSLTVRDTAENMRIIEKMLQSIDKDRAEVVMEVSIYEVSRTDLLQIGNQVGSASTLGNLGGVQPGSFLVGGARQLAAGASGVLPLSTGVGLLIPASSISALQSKNNTRLIFSTQVHAFDDEKSETRIGAKVPVQTASVFTGLSAAPQQGNNPGQGGAVGGIFGNGFPVIQYEDTGLVLDFKPKVYPNQDVQVSMKIETKDTNGDTLTPTFTQRSIQGVARIPNGKTMMIASIAQDRVSDGRQGLPLIGLIPILGRLFTAPRRDNVQSDVVITMTPRVLRAPSITPSDEETRDAGSMQTPKSESLEAMLRETEREEQLARARTLRNNTSHTVQIPAQPGEDYTYVPAPKALAESAAQNAQVEGDKSTASKSAPALNVSNTPETSAKLTPTPAVVKEQPATATAAAAAAPATDAPAEKTVATPAVAVKPEASGDAAAARSAAASSAPAASAPAASTAELTLLPERPEMKTGERRRVMVFMKTAAPIGLATATLRFDPAVIAVRSVSHGVLTSDASNAPVLTQSVDPKGVLLVSVAPAQGAAPLTGEGLLVIIEVEALGAGSDAIGFDADKVHFIATDGRSVQPRLSATTLKVAPPSDGKQ